VHITCFRVVLQVKSALASFYDAVCLPIHVTEGILRGGNVHRSCTCYPYAHACVPAPIGQHIRIPIAACACIPMVALCREHAGSTVQSRWEASPILSAKLPSTLREPSLSLPDSHLLRAPTKLNPGTSKPSLPPCARAPTRAHALHSNWNLPPIPTSPTCITPPGGLRASAATSELAGAASVQHNDPHGLNRPDRKHLSHTQPPTWACHPPTASPSTKLSPGTASAKAAPRPTMPHGRSGGHAPGAQVTAHSTPTWARAHAQPPTPARRPPAPRRR